MKQHSPIITGRALAALCGLLLVLGSAGCGLFKTGSASFASVTIHDHSPEQIVNATIRVFRADGYAGGSVDASRMVFQTEGTRMNNLAYEGAVNTHEGAQTMVRVRAEVVSVGEAYRLQCQAYMVRGVGDVFGEEEQRLVNARSGPYQRLLNKVEDELKNTGEK